ncbi:MAG: DNA cytosine methyltransferase [Oscillospiraceae bacterium]|nr:DNA cytosine methyltransferase [Oscillospiraceae bacterium]
MRKTPAPTLGSLFDGIGGFPLAGVLNGITPVWASEIEAFPILVTKIHFPEMLHVGDITKLKGLELPAVDIVTGGSPCQDLSIAGARKGLTGERSGLFMEQIRIIKEMRCADEQRDRAAHTVRPRYMVWENVPGAFSSGTPHGEDFRVVLEETARIADSGISIPRPADGVWKPAGCILGEQFSIAWRVLDTQYWPGTPQRRRRIFLVADFGGHSASKVLFEQNRLFGDFAESEGSRQGFAAAARSSVEGTGGVSENLTPIAFAANQRDEVRDLNNIAGALQAQPGIKQQTFVAIPAGVITKGNGECILTPEKHMSLTSGGGQAGQGYPYVLTAGFCATASSAARSIGFQEECAPTLKSSTAPSVICLNDQGEQRMDMFNDIIETLRAQMGGHLPLIMTENRTELDETFCIDGNIIGREDKNGGNGFGYQSDISYTVTATDRHAVFSQQGGRMYRDNNIVSTQTARQYKDATDLVCIPYQKVVGTLVHGDHKGIGNQYVADDKCIVEKHNLIRRLTPLECERLQGFPDGWTDIGGSDSARYKALGNSVAIPCVDFILKGIAYFLKLIN